MPAARKVQMTQMPQLAALFNGVGGGAAALVAIVEYLKLGDSAPLINSGAVPPDEITQPPVAKTANKVNAIN